jgi:cytochrome d ubiquinol oxidase subunit II
MTLDILWYLVIILALICYAVLDGFDLGVGSLHLFTKKDEHRRIFLNAIGPVWDGNEVWLVVVGGALFAGFPAVYATLCSGFYNLIMLLLCGLIFRAVAIEFRSKHEAQSWRKLWDAVFCIASLTISFGIGFVLGNLIQGVSLNEHHDYVGSFSDFFHPFSLLVGILTVSLFMMHGSIFLLMKTEGKLHEMLRSWVYRCIAFFIISYAVTTVFIFMDGPHMTNPMAKQPWLIIVPLLALMAIINIPFQISRQCDGWAFISSCFSIALLLSLFAIGTYPYMIRSTLDIENNSLIIFNSASSPLTLTVLLVIVAIGIPLVIGYGFYIYKVFRGKVKLDPSSY